MSKIISKELLEEVTETLDIDRIYLTEVNGRNVFIKYGDLEYPIHMNIHELAHKCKEWAILKHKENKDNLDEDFFYLNDITSSFVGYSYIWQCVIGYRGKDKDGDYYDLNKCFSADTEPEAIFKACQWIMENKNEQA